MDIEIYGDRYEDILAEQEFIRANEEDEDEEYEDLPL
jgi:hypothetical protein